MRTDAEIEAGARAIAAHWGYELADLSEQGQAHYRDSAVACLDSADAVAAPAVGVSEAINKIVLKHQRQVELVGVFEQTDRRDPDYRATLSAMTGAGFAFDAAIHELRALLTTAAPAHEGEGA